MLAKEYIKSVRLDDTDDVPFSSPPVVDQRTQVGNHSIERYIRVNVVKNTKGYNHDCTVSVTTTAPREVLEKEVRELLILASRLAEDDISRQKIEQYEKYVEQGQ